ncbi:S24 family peptidase [soil metagenome]
MNNDSKNRSVLNRRIAALMQEKGLSVATLAKKTGVAVGTIQKLIADPNCNPTIASLEPISNILGASISQLVGQDAALTVLLGRDVEVITWKDAMDTTQDRQVLPSQNNSAEIARTNCALSLKAFALKMKGSTMEPLFPEESILLFDPKRNFQDGGYVLVKLQNATIPVFKQILIDTPNLYIRSINPALKEKSLAQLNDKDVILATLVQSQLEY